MGGHGALICALKEPGRYRSVSAFAPICHPMACGWGQGCFGAYLGKERETWAAYDATRLIEDGAAAIPLLIDQGTDDEFLAQQFHPASLERICAAREFSADPALARGLRSQLSLHRHLYRRASRLSRRSSAVNQELLKWLESLLRGELNRTRRRKIARCG
jgi:hypothetical protein